LAAIEQIHTHAAPTPAGHCSQAAAYRDLVFVSGLLPVNLEGKTLADESFEVQVRVTLANLLAVLKEAGSGPDRVLKITAYMVGVENWPVFNANYAGIFGEARPARAVVPVTALHHGCLFEIEAVAVPKV
jgi:reactive intermediate/imine deaminase